jgi:hypothetical protein
MAYTKYSLTPANNNAAPPDGAPEGMLPSAVNDTMRDMMAQIRDVGDGIRGGTYTMTAPVITGGSVAGVTAVSTSGNLTFTGTGNRILGDFSNATVANRVIFQTSTTNGNTVVAIIPNGTSAVSAFSVFNNSNPTNAGILNLVATGTETQINSAITGTGTYLPLIMLTNGSERLRIDTSGNVGIGTTTARVPLSVNNADFTAGQANKIRLFDNGAALTYGFGVSSAQLNYNSADGAHVFYTGGTSPVERMRIDSSGNVGINSSSITQLFANYTQLQIKGGNTTAGGTLQFINSAGTITTNIVCDTNATYFAAVGGTAMAFAVGGSGTGTERMRIDSGGNWLLGTTSGAGKATISWASASQAGLVTRSTSETYAGSPIVFQNSSGGTSGFISQATSSVSYNTSSDYRLKENIAPMTGALAKVSALKPVTYNWKVDGSASQGFIAHELQEIVPECVTGEKDAVETVDDVDADGKVIGTKEVPKYQGVDTSFLVATLTASIQELKAIVDAQAARIAALENK